MSRTAQIAVCQFPIEPLRSVSDFEDRISTFLDAVPDATDYVVFPEALTGGLLTLEVDFNTLGPHDLIRLDKHTGRFRAFFSEEAQRRGFNIVAGSHIERDGQRYLNVAHLFSADGREICHQKTHIFPSEAEYLLAEGDELEVIRGVGPATVALQICYEAEIPEISRIQAELGAELVLCPSHTYTEHGFWRVRHSAQARCVENQIYFAHACSIGEPIGLLTGGFGRSAVLTPCDSGWPADGVLAEAESNAPCVVTAVVDLDQLHENRENGAARTFHDRQRRSDLYSRYHPYRAETQRTETLDPVTVHSVRSSPAARL
jgi:predicted amidohydrolase